VQEVPPSIHNLAVVVAGAWHLAVDRAVAVPPADPKVDEAENIAGVAAAASAALVGEQRQARGLELVVGAAVRLDQDIVAAAMVPAP